MLKSCPPSPPAILGATIALIHVPPCATLLCSQQGNVVRRMLGALLSLVTDNPPPHLSEDFGSHTFQNLLPESPPSLFQSLPSIHPPCKAIPSLHGPPTVVSSCPHSLQSHLETLSTDLAPPTLPSQALGHGIKLGGGRNSPHSLDAVLSGERISLLYLGLVMLWVLRRGQRGYHKEPLGTLKDIREPCVRGSGCGESRRTPGLGLAPKLYLRHRLMNGVAIAGFLWGWG